MERPKPTRSQEIREALRADDKAREREHLPHLPRHKHNPWAITTSEQYEEAMEMRGREI